MGTPLPKGLWAAVPILTLAAIISLQIDYQQWETLKIWAWRIVALDANPKTIAESVATLETKVKGDLADNLTAADLTWPVTEVYLVALKKEKILEVWARNDPAKPWVLLKDYDVLAASGKPGPKLREGDKQVPEGLYQIEALNPNSNFHLSLRLNYPNGEDLELAVQDKRNRIGGDIFVTGGSVSVGSLAMGNDAIEEIFVLVAQSKSPVAILVAPRDFRLNPLVASDWKDLPAWTRERYAKMEDRLKIFPSYPVLERSAALP